MSAKDKIRKVTRPFFVTEPLLFGIFVMHELVENEDISYIRVGKGRIEYNPSWVEEREPLELEHYLTFELIRILLKHPYKRIKPNKEVSYLASNITVDEITNLAVDIPSLDELAEDKDLSDKPGRTGYFEYYYSKLMEQGASEEDKQEEEPQDDGTSGTSMECGLSQGSDSQSGAGGGGDQDPTGEKKPSEDEEGDSGGNETGDDSLSEMGTSEGGEAGPGDPGDEDALDEESSSEGASSGKEDEEGTEEGNPEGNPYMNLSPEMMAEATENWVDDSFWDQMINEQIELAERTDGWGNMSGDLKETIWADLKPDVDYKYMLKKFKRTILSQDSELTRMRPNRRFDFEQQGKKRVCTTSIAVYVDVSGSIGLRDLRMMMSVCKNILHMGMKTVDVYFFDTKISNPEKPLVIKKAISKVNVCGRLGTDGQVCMDHFYQHRKKYDGMVMLTDGKMSEITVKNRRDLFMLFHTRSMWQGCVWKDRVSYSAYVTNWK